MARKAIKFTFDYHEGELVRTIKVEIRPHDPVTVCEVRYQYTPVIDQPNFWTLGAYGLGVRKFGDSYDERTGRERALISAMRKVDDKCLRRKIWEKYHELFPFGVEIEPTPATPGLTFSMIEDAVKAMARMFRRYA